MEPTQNGPLCRRCFQTHFLLPACQILPGPFLGKMVGIGTVYCISYWATHCHYNLITYNMYKNVFEENSEKCTAQSRVKDSFRGCRPAPGANSWFPHVVMSTWTPQPRSILLWSTILVSGLVVVLLSSLTASEYWKKKEKKNGRKSASDQANHNKNPLMRHQGCLQSSTWHVLIKKIRSVYSSVPSYSYGQIAAQSVSIRPYRDRRSGRIIACANLIFPHCPFNSLFPKTYVKHGNGWYLNYWMTWQYQSTINAVIITNNNGVNYWLSVAQGIYEEVQFTLVLKYT